MCAFAFGSICASDDPNLATFTASRRERTGISAAACSVSVGNSAYNYRQRHHTAASGHLGSIFSKPSLQFLCARPTSGLVWWTKPLGADARRGEQPAHSFTRDLGGASGLFAQDPTEIVTLDTSYP